MRTIRLPLLALAAFALVGNARADLTDSLKKGTPELKSAGSMCFGPDGVLFVADPQAGSIFAIDTGDKTAPAKGDRPNIKAIDEKIAGVVGVDAKSVLINDLAVNPISGNIYISTARGKALTDPAAIIRVGRDGKVEDFGLKDVKFSSVTIPNPRKTAGARGPAEPITDLAYINGKLIVAGMAVEGFDSTLRAIPFPFKEADKGTMVEIYHGAHRGALETRAPVRTFAVYDIGKDSHVLAAYQCTPLVTFPIKDLEPEKKVRGRTVAELGNGNKPLDIIIYTKGKKDYALLANSARGIMKIDLTDVATVEPITKAVSGTAGLPYETIKDMKDVIHLDRYDKDHVLLLIKPKDGGARIEVAELP